jgi:hypothetical protein
VRGFSPAPQLAAAVRSAVSCSLLVIIGAFVLAGCSDDPLDAGGGINLYVAQADTTIGGYRHVNITATVTNHGATDVVYRTSCSIYTWFAVYDGQGNLLRLHDPSYGQVCPLEPSVLVPWQMATAEMRFGVAWDAGGIAYRPQPGRYTLYTRFIFTEPGSRAEKRVDRRTAIDWE